ncbi:hypothetical protein ScPMuIL_003880 [Solemya velum]
MMGKQINTTIIRCCSSTNDSDEDAKAEFHKRLQAELENMPTYNMVIVIGDLNAKIGDFSHKMSSKLVVVALDFGTTYSGYAFSLRSDFKKKPTNIQLHQWSFENVSYSKVPTSILFDKFKKFHSFGFEAEETYAKLADMGQHKEWYLFRKFKMALYRNENLGELTSIKDTRGKTMAAMDVFAAGIRFLKDHLMKTLSDSMLRMEEGDIHWVLTVPAIWDESAKQFMRKSANKAGIANDNLTLALEPEAAAIYCKHLPDLDEIPVGSPFMVLDCGGGTVDVTVHEITIDGSLKELHKPTGGDWGGIKVDDAFTEFLLEELGMPAIRSCTEQDKFELQRSLEDMKKKVVSTGVMSYTMKIPECLIQQFQISYHLRKVKLVGDKLKIDADLVKSFFAESIRNILLCVEDVLAHPRVFRLHHVIMVGGYSDSELLVKAIQGRFPKLRVICPDEAASTVLKGAVIFGHRPESIVYRVMRFTYGVSTCTDYDPMKHSNGTLKMYDGVPICTNIFDKFIEIDEVLHVGYETEEKVYCPLLLDQTVVQLPIYYTVRVNPQYVTDTDCKNLGTLRVPMPDLTGQKSRVVRVKMILGGTEVKIEAVDGNTSILYNTSFDLMHH